MSFTLTTSAAILFKAGNAIFPAGNSAAMIAKYSDEAEGVVNALTKYDWVANYATVNTNFKPILDEAVSSYAAKLCIVQGMKGFIFRSEPQTMLDVYEDNFARCIKQLQENDIRTTMGGS